MLSAPAATCTNHRKRERIAVCCSCSASLCADCVVHTFVGIKCSKCTGGATDLAKRAASSGASRRRWAGPVAALGALMVAVFAVIVITRSDGSSGGGGDGEPAAQDGGTAAERNADFTGAGGLEMGATLTVPAGVTTNAPGVVIVPGGGTNDRNGIRTPEGQSDPLYQDVANSLAEVGVVSLRYDRRGTGQSQLAAGQELSFDDYVADAKAALDFLALRREVEGGPLAVVGYDQGGFVALRLAGTDPRVKGLVLISTPGRPLADVLADDFLRAIPDPAQGQAVVDALRAGVTQVVSTGSAPRGDTLPPALRPVFANDPAYLKGLFSFDPVAEAAKVTVPALVLRGANDQSITEDDAQRLQSALSQGDYFMADPGGNTLNLPPGQEGPLHDPSRHGFVRNGDTMANLNDWVKSRIRV